MKRDINLLQGMQTAKKQFDVSRSARQLAVAAVIFAVVLTAAYAGLRYWESYIDGQTAAVRAEAAGYTEVSEAKARAAEISAQVADIQALLDTASGTSYTDTTLLWKISSTLDEYTFLTSVTIGEAGSVAFSGKAAARDDITFFVYSLKQTGLFSDVAMGEINTAMDDKTGEVAAYEFTVSAVLKGGEKGE